jgi:hypothetical protein
MLLYDPVSLPSCMDVVPAHAHAAAHSERAASNKRSWGEVQAGTSHAAFLFSGKYRVSSSLSCQKQEEASQGTELLELREVSGERAPAVGIGRAALLQKHTFEPSRALAAGCFLLMFVPRSSVSLDFGLQSACLFTSA